MAMQLTRHGDDLIPRATRYTEVKPAGISLHVGSALTIPGAELHTPQTSSDNQGLHIAFQLVCVPHHGCATSCFWAETANDAWSRLMDHSTAGRCGQHNQTQSPGICTQRPGPKASDVQQAALILGLLADVRREENVAANLIELCRGSPQLQPSKFLHAMSHLVPIYSIMYCSENI